MDHCDVCDGKGDSCIDEFGSFTDKIASKFSEIVDDVLVLRKIMVSLSSKSHSSYLLSYLIFIWIHTIFSSVSYLTSLSSFSFIHRAIPTITVVKLLFLFCRRWRLHSVKRIAAWNSVCLFRKNGRKHIQRNRSVPFQSKKVQDYD